LVRSDFKYNINFSTLEVLFEDRSRGDIIAWNWNFGDGSTSTLQHPKHTYSEATLHEVCLTVTDINGCTKTRCDKLRLGADVCHASFAYAQDGLDLMFYNTSDVSNAQVTATWNFGDGGASIQYDSAAHTFELGVYEICITVTSLSCVDTYCETIDLSNPCLALKAKYSATKDGGDPLLYHFQDLSSGPVGSRLWGFGDGQISSQENPTHLYAGPGIYTVCLLTIDMQGNCTNSDCRTLFVGTTSTDTEEIKLNKLHIVPNPVSTWNPNIEISGFDINDIGSKATIKMINVQGVTLKSQEVILGKTIKTSTPYIPGLYYILVVSARNRYGAMIAVQ
jgi:PKD repeat protein